MLPFPIMNQYGNIVPQKPKILSMYSPHGVKNTYIHYSNNELYGFYSNSVGQLGLGDTIDRTDSFYLLNTDVRLFSASNRSLIVIKNDNTIWHSGDKLCYGIVSGNNITKFDITSLFSTIDISKIVKIQVISYGTAVLLDDGRLYAIGYNNYGEFGTSAYLTSLSLIASNVRDINGNAQHFGYIDINDNFYISGQNTFGQLGNGDTNTRKSFALLATSVKNVILSTSTTTVEYNDGRVYSCGQAGTAKLGINNITSGNVLTLTSIRPVLPIKFSATGKVFNLYGNSSFGLNGSDVYSNGYGTSSSLNTGNTTFGFQPTIGISQFDGICSSSSHSWYWIDNIVYYTGTAQTYLNPNSGETVPVFTKITHGLPY